MDFGLHVSTYIVSHPSDNMSTCIVQETNLVTVSIVYITINAFRMPHISKHCLYQGTALNTSNSTTTTTTTTTTIIIIIIIVVVIIIII